MTTINNSRKHHKVGWPLDPFPQPKLPADYLAPAPRDDELPKLKDDDAYHADL